MISSYDLNCTNYYTSLRYSSDVPKIRLLTLHQRLVPRLEHNILHSHEPVLERDTTGPFYSKHIKARERILDFGRLAGGYSRVPRMRTRVVFPGSWV